MAFYKEPELSKRRTEDNIFSDLQLRNLKIKHIIASALGHHNAYFKRYSSEFFINLKKMYRVDTLHSKALICKNMDESGFCKLNLFDKGFNFSWKNLKGLISCTLTFFVF